MRIRVAALTLLALFTTTVSAASSPASCPSLTRNLSFGSRGSDVASLQTFLGVESSGYFGAKTEEAVKLWQSQNGIVNSGDALSTGWGRVGSRTRQKIMQLCTASSAPTKTPKPDDLDLVVATEGHAPFTVYFYPGTQSQGAIPCDDPPPPLDIDFGDGQSGTLLSRGRFGDGECEYRVGPLLGATASESPHTYTKPGTYVATFWNADHSKSASAIITVTPTPKTTGFKADAQSGTAPLDVQFTWELIGGSAQSDYAVDFGDGHSCAGAACDPGVAPGQMLPGIASHGYGPGTYIARLTNARKAINETVTLTVVNPVQKPVSMWANPVDGTAPLSVSFGWRTWDSAGSSFVIDFGDGSQGAATKSICTGVAFAAGIGGAIANTMCSPMYQTTHIYKTKGIYAATLKNGIGELVGTITVTVR
ncbi:MAG: hypothetical protein JO019_04420 [Candidatus Kaiserbacteria bacterium]|nr:hypothetical protein [Candidatus Kaiserbacteria bacterium]